MDHRGAWCANKRQVVERFGISLLEVGVVLHPLQGCVVAPSSRFSEVLRESVTFFFTWCSCTTKFSSDYLALNWLNTASAIHENA